MVDVIRLIMMDNGWLVVWNMNTIFPFSLESSSQLTNSYFSGGMRMQSLTSNNRDNRDISIG